MEPDGTWKIGNNKPLYLRKNGGMNPANPSLGTASVVATSRHVTFAMGGSIG
jgi:hypothetical protein